MKNKDLKIRINALYFSLIGFALAILLLIFKFIGETSFIILIGMSIISGIFILYPNKIQSMNLYKGEIILRDIQDTEKSIKELAKAILEVTEASSHSIMLESFDSEAYNEAVEKLRDLT